MNGSTSLVLRGATCVFLWLASSRVAAALDKNSRPDARFFEISAPSRYRLVQTLTVVVHGHSVSRVRVIVPQPLRFPWSAGSGRAVFESASFTPGRPEWITSPGPAHTWRTTDFGPYWMELRNAAGGEGWRWTLTDPASGPHEQTVSYEFATADRRFRRELVRVTLGDLEDPAKMPPEFCGAKAAICALTEPLHEGARMTRPRLPLVLGDAVGGVLAKSGADGDIFMVINDLSRWLTARFTYAADKRVVDSARDNLYENLALSRGDCVTFSCTFVAMANAAGIPARVVMGLTCKPFAWPPDPVQPKTYRDLVGRHTWAEVFLPGIGWVEVEPQASAGERPNIGADGWDAFFLRQYTQLQLTDVPLLQRWEAKRRGDSATLVTESELVRLSPPEPSRDSDAARSASR